MSEKMVYGILDLPVEVLVYIMCFSQIKDERNIRLVCSEFDKLFNHTYSLEYYKLHRENLIGKYSNLDHIPHGIFRVMKPKPSNLKEYKNQCKILQSLKLMSWGNNKSGLCGVDSPRTIFEKPLQLRFPEGDIPWFVTHSHETITAAITLTGKVFCWGGYSERMFAPKTENDSDSDSDSDSNLDSDSDKMRSRDPQDATKLNDFLESYDEIPICVAVDHCSTGVLTNKGTLYVTRSGGKICKIDRTPRRIENIIACDFTVWILFEQEEKHNYVKLGHIPYYYGDGVKNLNERSIYLRKNERVVRMESDYSRPYFLTNQNRLIEIKNKGKSLSRNGFLENIVDFTGARSQLLVTTEGKLYGRGQNRQGQLGQNIDTNDEIGVEFYYSGVEMKVIEASNGTDFSAPCGQTMFMDEERNLYTMGGNRNGEQLKPPDKKSHAPRSLKNIVRGNVLVFNANENYCAVIVCDECVKLM